MKKKLMMIAVLLGALSLGACVDDNETQSVTDVRNAKAEQLKARAELNNAKAQATKIAADAEVALMNAQAKAQQALAKKAQAEALEIQKRNELIELQKAEAELENEAQMIENQKKQLEVEQALRDLEVAKAQAEKDLADVVADLTEMEAANAAALAQAQADLLASQKAIVDYEKQMAAAADAAEKAEMDAKVAELTRLSSVYTIAVNKLITAQSNLTAAKKNLVVLENDLTDWTASREEYIADQEKYIARYEDIIAKYKEYTNYTEDVTALENKLNELLTQQGVLYDDYLNKVVVYNDIDVDLEAVNALTDTLNNYNDYVRYLNSGRILKYKQDENQTWYDTYTIWDLDWWRYDLGLSNGYEDFFSNSHTWGSLTSLSKEYVVEYEDQSISFYEGDSLAVDVNTPNIERDLRTVELYIGEMKAAFEAQGKEWKAKLDEYKANYNGTATGYYAYAGAPDETPYAADAAKKLNAVDSTLAAKAAYDADPSLEWKYRNALNVEIWLKDQIESYEASLVENARQQEALDAYLAYYGKQEENLAALQVKLDERNEQEVAARAEKVAAYGEYLIAYWTWDAIAEEITAVDRTLNGYNGVKGAEWLETQIANYERSIERLKKAIEDAYNAESQEQMIELQKMRVEICEVELKAAELVEADAKADLDAALAEDAE